MRIICQPFVVFKMAQRITEHVPSDSLFGVGEPSLEKEIWVVRNFHLI